MGGTPLTALAITCFPKEGVDFGILKEIMRGGLSILSEHRVALLGGHSVDNPQIMFGYAVTGTVDTNRIVANAGSRAGDVLLLTKPIGTGVVSTAIKFAKASTEVAASTRNYADCRQSRCTGNAGVQDHWWTRRHRVRALGHSLEMAQASNVTFEIDSGAVPLIDGAFGACREWNGHGRGKSNGEFVGDNVSFGPSVTDTLQRLLFDPQTAGGLLISAPEGKAMLWCFDFARTSRYFCDRPCHGSVVFSLWSTEVTSE
jgi:selenide,water dikinase